MVTVTTISARAPPSAVVRVVIIEDQTAIAEAIAVVCNAAECPDRQMRTT
jgi:hypothetical protein